MDLADSGDICCANLSHSTIRKLCDVVYYVIGEKLEEYTARNVDRDS